MKLKQSVPDWCFFKNQSEPPVYYQRLREIGYLGVEMVDQSRLAAAKAAGLKVINLSAPGMQKGLNRMEYHAELIPEIRRSLGYARDNNIACVIVFSGNRNGQADEDGIKNCASALKQLAIDAEKAGVILTFEMLNSINHVDYQADHTAFGIEIVRRVSSPAVKLLYDIYHMQKMGEDACADIIKNMEMIAHIHVADTPRRTLPSLAGGINYRNVVTSIHAAGYRGYWGQEFLPQQDPMQELKQAHDLFESFMK